MATTSTRFFHLSLTGPALSRLEEAEEFYLAGNLNEALAAAQQAWREHPRDPDVFRVLAYIHMARGEYQPAAQAAYQSVVVEEGNPASYATLAQVYLTFNMIGNARETLDTARKHFPQDAALMVLAADLHFRTRKDDAAAELAIAALKINPHDGYAKALLGVHYLRKKKYPLAAEYLGEAVLVYPQRWDYLRDLGIAMLQTGAPELAKGMLIRSLGLNQTDAATKQHLWYALSLSQANPSPFTKLSFFFYNNSGLGWGLNILGMLSAIVGGIWLLVLGSQAASGEITNLIAMKSAMIPMLLLLGGIALLILTGAGITMRNKKGKRFDLTIRRMLEQEPVVQAPAAGSGAAVE